MLSFDFSRLVPAGLSVDGVEDDEIGVIIHAHPASARGRCPDCGTWSARVHSRYTRKLNDLPIGGRRVQLVVRARRFFCEASSCRRRTFAERLDGTVAPKARRTGRLDEIVFCLAIALGGRPAAALAKRIEIKVSNDTLLRAVRRRGSSPPLPPSVIGIDDWAWRRNFRYGTLICDLERRKTIALLPDREPATAEAVVEAMARHHGHRARSWRRLRPGGAKGVAQRGSGRRSLASHGERQRGLSRRRPQVDASNSGGHWRGDDQSRVADCRRTAPVRRLPAPRGDQRFDIGDGGRRRVDQGNPPQNLDTAVSSFVPCCVASDRIFSAPGKARWSLGFHGWTNNGRQVGGTAPNSGATSSGGAFVDVFESQANGLVGDDEQTSPKPRSVTRRRRERSRDCSRPVATI